jgi:uncharacterized coiled-coil protein SlyX
MDSFPAQWDLTSSHSDQQIVNYYNNILNQQLAHTNNTFPSMGAKPTTSSRGSISSSSSSPSGSRSPPLPKTASAKQQATPSRGAGAAGGSNASKEERRREQNRASQRAYRDRKDKQLKALEVQIAQWQAKHQGLCSSYTKQTSEVRKLKSQIDELTSKIIAVQTGLLAQSPIDFDMVPGGEYDWSNLG